MIDGRWTVRMRRCEWKELEVWERKGKKFVRGEKRKRERGERKRQEMFGGVKKGEPGKR